MTDTPRTDRVARGRTEIASPTVVDVEFARTLERELAQARGNHQACTRMRESLERKLDEAEAALRAAPVSEEREEVAQRVFLACVGSCTCMTKTPEPEHHKTDCLYRVLSDAYRLLRAPQQQAEPVAWRIHYERDGDGWYIVDSPHRPAEVEGWQPLYAAPPVQAESEAVRLLREFCGWISGDLPELHKVEVPRIAESLDRYLARKEPKG